MKNKKIWITLFAILIVAIVSFGVYRYFTGEDKNTTLTILEKQWIESNKNKVIDLAITNNIPVFNYNGEGVFFDFLTALEKDTGLEFNKISLNYQNEAASEYAFQIKETVEENDILVYQDTLSLITAEKVKYNRLDEIQNLTIGVTNADLEKVSAYFSGLDVTFKAYETRAELISALIGTESEEEDSIEREIDAIVVPQLVYLKEVVENADFHIAYQLEGLNENYVLTLGSTDRLNTIIRKYYQKWASDHFENSFNKYFSSHYFTYKQVGEKEKADFRSKRYVYGFIDNRPYDTIYKNKLAGINSNILRAFSKLADIEISYNEYSSMEALLTAFNENKIDFFYGTNANTTYDMDVYDTVSTDDEAVVILSDVDYDLVMNSLYSLKGKEVLAVKGTKIADYLQAQDVKITEVDSINKLLEMKTSSSIIAIDEATYEYYVHDELERFTKDYTFYLPSSYQFIVRDINANSVFAEFFDLYLSFINERTFTSPAYGTLLDFHNGNNIFLTIITIILGGTVGLFAIFGLYKYIHMEKKQASLSKGDKIKYIDQLTSLKNRNYLNDNIEAWDESEVYPQSIVIVDLNNVAYINDNYGHQEGDNVIKEAANILIKTQIPNSDILRTSGNEFLIYLVGYDEKQIVAYIRKLNKEMKELAHGFGAAVGYSMITDAIKTIDDAVNEATLDMRTAKEENNN